MTTGHESLPGAVSQASLVRGEFEAIRPTLVTALDQNNGESDSVEILNDYVLIVDGTCTFEVIAIEGGGETHVIRVTGRSVGRV